MYYDQLQHYGIPGMHWGKRQSVVKLSRSNASTSNKKESAKELSDEELNRKVRRLQLEKQYSDLTSTSVSKGKAYVEKFIKAGTKVAALTTTALTLYNNADKIKKIISKT